MDTQGRGASAFWPIFLHRRSLNGIYKDIKAIIMIEQLDQPIKLKDPGRKDLASSLVDSSVFLFYLQVFCMVAMLAGGSCGLYAHRYKGKPKVNVPGNTFYTPEYK